MRLEPLEPLRLMGVLHTFAGFFARFVHVSRTFRARFAHVLRTFRARFAHVSRAKRAFARFAPLSRAFARFRAAFAPFRALPRPFALGLSRTFTAFHVYESVKHPR